MNNNNSNWTWLRSGLVAVAGAALLAGSTAAATNAQLYTVNLATGLVELSFNLGEVWDTSFLAGIENATGGELDDRLIGNAGDNVLVGGAGND